MCPRLRPRDVMTTTDDDGGDEREGGERLCGERVLCGITRVIFVEVLVERYIKPLEPEP